MNYWLLKSEDACYSIDDLKRDRRTAWTGIRNYQARNFMRDSMKDDDLCFFYHSSSDPTGIYGIAKVVGTPHPDETQFNTRDEHFDPKSKKENPTWICVDIAFVKKFTSPISLGDLKRDSNLEGMAVRERGSRLSIQPVSEKHFRYITEKL